MQTKLTEFLKKPPPTKKRPTESPKKPKIIEGSLPFQLQLRSFGERKKDYWIVLSKTGVPDAPEEHPAVIAIKQADFASFVTCSRDKVTAFKDSARESPPWDCEGKSSREKSCEVVSEGSYERVLDQPQYKLKFARGEHVGNELDFRWRRKSGQKTGFVFGEVSPKNCEGEKVLLEEDLPENMLCTDIWDKEKRWAYYQSPLVQRELYRYMHGHPFRFRYVSTTQHNRTPKELRKPDTGAGAWIRKMRGKVLRIPEDVAPEDVGSYLRKVHSGITELHYEPSVDVVDGVRARKRVSEIIIDMDIEPDYPFEKITKIARITKKIAPKVVQEALGLSTEQVSGELVYTGKTSYHLHLSIPRESAIPYDGVRTMDDPSTVSGLICEIADRVNKELGEDDVLCGQGHGEKVGFDFASCNAPGKNCVVPFSFRIPDVERGIYTCRVAVPVDFEKIPDFDPDLHATSDFVIGHPRLFSEVKAPKEVRKETKGAPPPEKRGARPRAVKKKPAPAEKRRPRVSALSSVPLLGRSHFFRDGYYKKAEPCPKTYSTVAEGDELCGESVPKGEAGSSKLDVKKSLSGCIMDEKTYVVETKFNGHRGILEFRDGKAGIFSGKGLDDKPLPSGIAKLAGNYYLGNLSERPGEAVDSIILDGEVFLKECEAGGKKIVPEIGIQTAAIKGEHPELMENCKFSYQAFDVIQLNGRDVSELPLEDRKKILKKIFPKPVSARMSDVIGVKRANTPENLFIEPVLGKSLSSVEDIHKEYCKATKKGQEGLVIKSPEDPYSWRGLRSPSRAGWYKLKEEFDVDASVMKACLGSWSRGTKTNQHLTRYKDLRLYVCKDPDCDSMLEVAKSGSNADGGMIRGWDAWDEQIHFPLLGLLQRGVSSPAARTKYRALDVIKDKLRRGELKEVNSESYMRRMMGCEEEGDDECYKNTEGEISLPECISVPKNEFIVEVVTTEINMKKGIPHLGGPPRVMRVRDDKELPNDVAYLKSLYGQEIGLM